MGKVLRRGKCSPGKLRDQSAAQCQNLTPRAANFLGDKSRRRPCQTPRPSSLWPGWRHDGSRCRHPGPTHSSLILIMTNPWAARSHARRSATPERRRRMARPYHRYTRLGQHLRIAANARDKWRIVNFFQARRRRSVVHREPGYAGWRRACDLFPR
jgi:hypothetical protein